MQEMGRKETDERERKKKKKPEKKGNGEKT